MNFSITMGHRVRNGGGGRAAAGAGEVSERIVEVVGVSWIGSPTYFAMNQHREYIMAVSHTGKQEEPYCSSPSG